MKVNLLYFDPQTTKVIEPVPLAINPPKTDKEAMRYSTCGGRGRGVYLYASAEV